MNETESRQIGKVNKVKNWFFTKINKFDKPLATSLKREKTDS